MGIYEEIASNKRRSILLVLFFFVFIILIGMVIGLYWGNSYFGIILAIVVGVIYFLFSYYGGAGSILAMSGAKEAQKPEHAYLINTVEGLSIAAGIPMPKVYVIEDTALNAFATGRDPKNSYVAVTSGLLKKLNRQELEGVLAHEISHVKNYDIRVMMLAAVMVGVTVLLSDFLLRSFLWGGKDRDRENNQATLVLILVGFVLAILSPLIGEMMKLAISRKREFLADASAALITRHPKGLADALRKIKEDPDPLVDHANKATAHLYISTPFRHDGKKGSWLQNLFSTHPDINLRIQKLDEM
jgi:heat shock protein HtpX